MQHVSSLQMLFCDAGPRTGARKLQLRIIDLIGRWSPDSLALFLSQPVVVEVCLSLSVSLSRGRSYACLYAQVHDRTIAPRSIKSTAIVYTQQHVLSDQLNAQGVN